MFWMQEIGDEYKNEIVNPTTKDRVGLLRDLEAYLQQILRNLPQVKRMIADKQAYVPQGPGRVLALARFHEMKGNNTVLLDQLGEKIVMMRKWLHRQGARLTVDGKIIWELSQVARVLYDTDLRQQQATRITISAGRFTTPDGKPLDTAKMSTAFSGPGWAIYVVSGEGHLHIAPHIVGQRHHSSLLAGQAVACAGEVMVTRGVLNSINNKSGHYRPPPYYMAQVLRYFAANYGLNPDTYTVRSMTGPRAMTDFPSGTRFLASVVIPLKPAPAPIPMAAPSGPSYANQMGGEYAAKGIQGIQYAPKGPAGPAYANIKGGEYAPKGPTYLNGLAGPYNPQSANVLVYNPKHMPPPVEPEYLMDLSALK